MKERDLELIEKTNYQEKKNKRRFREYLRHLWDSAHKKMSRGAENISKVITSAHKDNWRRGREKKK